ncbi:MerR family DNA-binding transcriptional regulator [Virgisporangium ochraceum]
MTFNKGEGSASDAVESDLLSIGELARASGLSASALRFYDRAGVLRPAHDDAATGYRWYLAGQVRPARVVAALRRVAMPVAEIGRVLAGPAEVATALIDGHLRRLETGLADARHELSQVRGLIEPEELPMGTTATVRAADLAGALNAVRFAVGSDPELPMLAGVLVELASDAVRLVATDRFRLAVAAAPCVAAAGSGGTSAIAPTPFVDRVRALLDAAGTVGTTAASRSAAGTNEVNAEVTVDGGRITVRAGEREVTGTALPHDYPDYRRLLPRAATRSVPVNAHRLREDLAAAGDGAVAVLSVGTDDSVGVETGEPVAGAARIGVNPRFLAQALVAAGDRRIMLELREPAQPMVLRPAGGPADMYSLLMPVRLDTA